MNYAKNAVNDALSSNPFRAEMNPQDLVNTLDIFWSKVATNVKAGMKDAQLQGIYAVLFSQVREECNRIAWEDDPVVYTRVANKNMRKDIAAILLVAAALIMFLTTFLMESKRYTLGMILCGLALILLVAGIALQSIKGDATAHIVEQRLRPQAIATSLLKTATVLDDNAENLLGLINPVGTPTGLQALDLVCEVYRASATENSNVKTALDRYLRQNSVREVPYSEDTASLFNIMPSNATRTLQPALIQETAQGDHVLAKGLACVQMIK